MKSNMSNVTSINCAQHSQCDPSSHEWVVFSTAVGEGWLMLQCVICGAHGTVDNPSRQQWKKAFHAPATPYRWSDNEAVTLRHPAGNDAWYVARTETGYERIPREFMGTILPVTEDEKADLEGVAKTVINGDLGGNLFPLSIRSFQNDTGIEPSGVVKRLASRIEELDSRGIPLSPKKVASILRWYARGGRPQQHPETEIQ